MQKLDVQGRLNIPEWMFQKANLDSKEKVLLAYRGNNMYEVIPYDDVFISDKVCSTELSVDAKNRIIVPKAIRRGYMPWVITYLQDEKLIIEFLAYDQEAYQDLKDVTKEDEKEKEKDKDIIMGDFKPPDNYPSII